METQVADLLGGERVLGMSVKSNLDLARATRQGLPAETAVQLFEAIRGADVIAEADGLRHPRPKSSKIIPQELDNGAEGIGLTAMGPFGALIGSLYSMNRSKTGGTNANSWPERLTPEQSDVVIRTACTLAKAIDILGDREKAAHWLTTPNRALGGE